MYQVWRHGGNGNHSWRVILETADEARAVECYEKTAAEMRQGGVVLQEVAGEEQRVLRKAWAPRLWTRW